MKKRFLLITLILFTVFGSSISAKTCPCDHLHDENHICTCLDDCPLKPMPIGCDVEFGPCP